MENHLKFKTGEQRRFLLKISNESGLSTDQLSKMVGISSRNYRDWLIEKYSISQKAGNILSKKFSVNFPEKQDILLGRWQDAKKESGKKGGHAYFKKYGSLGTLEGRKKGGSRTLAILRRRGIIPIAKVYNFPKSYGSDLAEFVGIVLGDGGVTSSQCIITLSREADRDYIPAVSGLGLKLFGERPKIYKRKTCKADDLCYNGIKFVEYLATIGIKTGNKVKQQVDVPEWIKKNREYSFRCVRGLIDTDGCITIHRYKVGNTVYRYRKLNFSNHSYPLILFVKQILNSIGLTPKLAGKLGKDRVWLYNYAEVQKYLRVIGSSNTRLLRFKESGQDGNARVR